MITIEDIQFQHNILTLYVHGELENEGDLSDYLSKALQIYHHYLPRFLLLEETMLDNQLELFDNFDFADWLSESQLIKNLDKIAIVCSLKDMESSRDFANFLENRGINFKVFLEQKDAIKWFEEVEVRK